MQCWADRRHAGQPQVMREGTAMQEHDITFRFESPVLLFGAAPVTAEMTARLASLSALPVLAADGGARTALALGLVPQAVIGDMDSLGVRDDMPASIRQVPMAGHTVGGKTLPRFCEQTAELRLTSGATDARTARGN